MHEKIRTPDTLVRSQVLYPAELHAHIASQQSVLYIAFFQKSRANFIIMGKNSYLLDFFWSPRLCFGVPACFPADGAYQGAKTSCRYALFAEPLLAIRLAGHTRELKRLVGMPFSRSLHLLSGQRGIPGSLNSLEVCFFTREWLNQTKEGAYPGEKRYKRDESFAISGALWYNGVVVDWEEPAFLRVMHLKKPFWEYIWADMNSSLPAISGLRAF